MEFKLGPAASIIEVLYMELGPIRDTFTGEVGVCVMVTLSVYEFTLLEFLVDKPLTIEEILDQLKGYGLLQRLGWDKSRAEAQQAALKILARLKEKGVAEYAEDGWRITEEGKEAVRSGKFKDIHDV